ncbi:hypothetical protein [Neptuniibacter sp. QD37_11]|uniref:hypothetical protein n=1 Tax=Neptuniibacter sp. QD37_11 TaxID=3398209 RepID=UPI0039F51851
MSKYEWETAEYTLPSAAMVPFRKAVVGAHNEYLTMLFTKSARAVENVKATHKGRRNVDWHQVVKNELTRLLDNDQSIELASHLFRDSLFIAGNKRPLKPQKKQIPLKKISSPNVSIEVGEANITICTDKRTIRWHIPENNHAVDHAMEHFVFQAVLNALGRVKWTRTTGGQRWGSDEYAQDAAQEFGHDPINYYGQLGNAKEDRFRLR